MERAWLFEKLAITVAWIDFLDPAFVGQPDVRERGVRVEVKPARSTRRGSVYVSSEDVMAPAICRIDLLESRPHAADRMHWHPTMHSGEPGDRTMEAAIAADPVGWLSDQLEHLDALLVRAGVTDLEGLGQDVVAIRAAAGEIAASAASGLEWARETPWPPAVHDERGLAVGTT